jgi:hypothetical protein
MNVKTCTLSVFLVFSCPTFADDSEKDANEPEPAPLGELTPELLDQLDKYLGREKKGFVIPPNAELPLENQQERSGEWIEKDGVLMCDGYLTRIESEEFCAAEIPAGWLPFEFNGHTYYVQPLSSLTDIFVP